MEQDPLHLNLHHKFFDLSLPDHWRVDVFGKENSKLAVGELKKHIGTVIKE
jgi:hypothetical protein